MIKMQKLNMVKYACTEADAARLEKKGFKAVMPVAPPVDPGGEATAEGQPPGPERKTGRAGKKKTGEKDGSDG